MSETQIRDGLKEILKKGVTADEINNLSFEDANSLRLIVLNELQEDEGMSNEFEFLCLLEKALRKRIEQHLRANPLLAKAMEIVYRAHEGQEDLAGKPYFLHPLSVMLMMDTMEEKIVAVLHDVVEDSGITIEDLREEGFSEKILEAIGLLTRDKEKMSYDQYIALIKGNDLVRKVKLADLRHNMDIGRIENPTEKDFARIEKYKRAEKFLLEE